MDSAIDFSHGAVAFIMSIYTIYSNAVLLKFPHAMCYLLAGNAIAASLVVLKVNEGKPKQYWLHSFILVLFGGFAGGFFGPILIGKLPVPIANDAVVPIVLVVWYATHNLGLAPVFSAAPVKFVWTFFVALFRSHAVCNMVATAVTVLKAGPYYPCALIGPIVVGTVAGSAAAFFPTDKGLAAITNGTVWPLQAAFMTSAFYHIMVNDTEGMVGNAFRSVFGTHSESTIRIVIVTIQLISLYAQAFFSPSANLFSPLHKVLYLIFQVEGPKNQDQKVGETVSKAKKN